MTTLTANDINLGEVESAGGKLGLTQAELAAIIGVDHSTLYRWRKGESNPRAMCVSRIRQVQEIFELLRSVFDGPDLARQWLRTARPESLGGQKTPMDVMLGGRADRVLNTLDFIARGA